MNQNFFGIDIGTSVSKIAFADFSGKKIIPALITRIGEQGLVPSAVLLNEQGEIVEYGKKALESYISGDGYHLVREFKLKIGAQITLPNGRIVEGRQIYKAFLKYLIKSIASEEDEITLEKARLCITHPADPDKVLKPHITSICEEVVNELIPDSAVSTFSMDEPAAVVQYTDYLQNFLTPKQTKILIIDTGAGTTDFAYATVEYKFVVQRQPLDVIFTGKVEIGGRDVDLAIWKGIRRREHIAEQDERTTEKVLASIRAAKNSYLWGNDDLVVDLIKIDKGLVNVTHNNINKDIDKLISDIVANVDKFMEKLEIKEQVQMIILAGGNSRIPLLHKKLEAKYPDLEIKTNLNNSDLQTTVAKGAALFAHTTYDGIHYPLAYNVAIEDVKGARRTIFKKGEKFPQRKKNPRQIIANYGSGDFKFIFYKESSGSSSEENERIEFNINPLPNTKVIMAFDIDLDGFLRYSVELWNKPDIVHRVLKKDLFDTAVPLWD